MILYDAKKQTAHTVCFRFHINFSVFRTPQRNRRPPIMPEQSVLQYNLCAYKCAGLFVLLFALCPSMRGRFRMARCLQHIYFKPQRTYPRFKVGTSSARLPSKIPRCNFRVLHQRHPHPFGSIHAREQNAPTLVKFRSASPAKESLFRRGLIALIPFDCVYDNIIFIYMQGEIAKNSPFLGQEY